MDIKFIERWQLNMILNSIQRLFKMEETTNKIRRGDISALAKRLYKTRCMVQYRKSGWMLIAPKMLITPKKYYSRLYSFRRYSIKRHFKFYKFKTRMFFRSLKYSIKRFLIKKAGGILPPYLEEITGE